MNSWYRIAVVVTLLLTVSACSKIPGAQLLGQKAKKEVVLKPLKALKPTLKTKTLWQVKTAHAMGDNKLHPYIDNKAVFIAGSNSASAWNTSDGKNIWKSNIGETITAGVNGTLLANPQGRAGVIPQASQVFIGTITGNAIALDAKTGKIQWIERLSSEVLAVSPSENGRVVFRTVDGKLHGLKSNTGELIWRRSQASPALTQLGASVPVIVANFVIAGFDNGRVAAYALQAGTKLWEIELSQPSANSDFQQIVDVDGRLKALGNALFASSMNGSLVGINMQTGKSAWSRAFSSPSGVDAIGSGLYVSDDAGLIWRIDPQSGNPVWSQDDLKGRQPSAPIIINNAAVVVTDMQGNIHFISASSGNFVARQKGDPNGYSVAPVISGKSIYLLGKSGVLSKLSL